MIEDVLNQLDDAYTVDVLKKMIRISSVVGEEAELAHFLYEELDAMGFACEMHEVEPGRPNIYARLKGSDAGRKLNFNGHTDTVPVVAGGDTDPLVPLQKDACLRDAHKIITFYSSSSSNCSCLAILSPRLTEILTEGCETPSFLDSSVALKPSFLTAQ